MQSPDEALYNFCLRTLPKLSLFFVVLGLLPLPINYFMGNGGDPVFALVAPVLITMSTGLVCISWWILETIAWPMGLVVRILPAR
jgi:hypothetical protein